MKKAPSTLLLLLLWMALLAVAPMAMAERAVKVCRPAPPNRPKAGLINSLIIGDSISLGYTPYVVKRLPQFQVQHGPYSSDGGAQDTNYQVECTPLWLTLTNMQQATHYDSITLNSGIHDVDYDGLAPEQYVPLDQYTANLRVLKQRLLDTLAYGIGFVLSTPLPGNMTANAHLVRYNDAARHVWQNETVALPVLDLYTAVVAKCGPPPYYNCSISLNTKEKPSPHYTPEGYEYLSSYVAPFLKSISPTTPTAVRQRDAAPSSAIPCLDATGAQVGACPSSGYSCAPCSYSNTGVGCCPFADAVACPSSMHCCPKGKRCADHCAYNHFCDCV